MGMIADLPLGDFTEAGTVPKPLPIRRAGRLAFGAFTIFVFSINLVGVRAFVSTDFGNTISLYWIAVFAAWWYFSDLVAVGFGKQWGRWPQVATFPVVLALIAANLAAYGSVWAPPLGRGIFIFTEFYFGYFSVSFLLAAIFAVPG